jgi:hypothetical protein
VILNPGVILESESASERKILEIMLYLAQVTKNSTSGEMELQLLAHQKKEESWEIITNKSVPFNNIDLLSLGLLLLVEIGNNQEIIRIKKAKEWIVNIIDKYLKHPRITPELFQEEKEKIEQWRQEITAQNLDLTRRHLEIEIQREQLQELEAKLKLEKEKLEIRISASGS